MTPSIPSYTTTDDIEFGSTMPLPHEFVGDSDGDETIVYDVPLPSAIATSSSLSEGDVGAFFQQQDDLVSEVLSFLDLRSLLTMSTTYKKAAMLLRYDHVFTSAKATPATPRTDQTTSSAASSNTSTTTTTISEKNAQIILNKLSKVYRLDNATTTNSCSSAIPKLPLTLAWKAHTKPTPLRLLRLANGKKCEKCMRDLRSPCIWAGRSGFGNVILPSLSFGAFYCTQCIFVDNTSSTSKPRATATNSTPSIPSTMRHPLLVGSSP